MANLKIIPHVGDVRSSVVRLRPPADADFLADLETWREGCAVSREIVAAHELDQTARPLDWYEDVDLRWLMLKMITEYAQHCGHADLLREGVDGTTGA